MNINVLEKSVVWQKSYKLVLDIYRVTRNMPIEERYGLIGQIKRACISIVLNIAEGRFRSSRQDFARFLSISKGSCGELVTALMLARDLGYIKKADFESLTVQAIEITRILNSSIRTLNNPS